MRLSGQTWYHQQMKLCNSSWKVLSKKSFRFRKFGFLVNGKSANALIDLGFWASYGDDVDHSFHFADGVAVGSGISWSYVSEGGKPVSTTVHKISFSDITDIVVGIKDDNSSGSANEIDKCLCISIVVGTLSYSLDLGIDISQNSSQQLVDHPVVAEFIDRLKRILLYHWVVKMVNTSAVATELNPTVSVKCMAKAKVMICIIVSMNCLCLFGYVLQAKLLMALNPSAAAIVAKRAETMPAPPSS